MKACDNCGQQMDEGFIIEVYDPENPHEPDLAEVCESCHVEIVRPEPEDDPEMVEPCDHVWRASFGGECEQCTLCGIIDC